MADIEGGNSLVGVVDDRGREGQGVGSSDSRKEARRREANAKARIAEAQADRVAADARVAEMQAEKAARDTAKESSVLGRVGRALSGRTAVVATIAGLAGVGLSGGFSILGNILGMGESKTAAGKEVAGMRRDIASLNVGDNAIPKEIRALAVEGVQEFQVSRECGNKLADAYERAAKSAVELKQNGKGGSLPDLFFNAAQKEGAGICKDNKAAGYVHQMMTDRDGPAADIFLKP